MSQWYCVVAGKQHGPIAQEVLCQWAQQGRVGPGDLVWTEGMAEWAPARTVAALLSAFPPVAGPPAGLRPHRGGAVLALGILGLLTCFVLGIIAWVMGKNDLREMDAARMDPSGRGTTQAGKILGHHSSSSYACGMAGHRCDRRHNSCRYVLLTPEQL